jgi:anti-sigma factor RsiW
MNGPCDNLDAFLNGELPGEDALTYEGHLAQCEACREAVDQQHWIDSLLRSPARNEIEPAPPTLPRTVRHLIQSRRRRARLAACGLAAAAAVIIAAGWIAVLNRQARDSESGMADAVIAKTEPSHRRSLQGSATSQPPRAVFVGGEDVFVAAVQSPHPNVTIVRIYPTYNSSLASEPSVESSDADHFNGG